MATTITTSSISPIMLDEFLRLGNWSPNADDNIHGELLSPEFVSNLITTYHQDPDNRQAIAGLGLLVLAEAVAGWGMDQGSSLPDDPQEKQWRGPSRVNQGKHLMSYAIGGIGIPHVDSSFLKKLFHFLKTEHVSLARKGDRFFKLRGINYDRIRANGGVCAKPQTSKQLDLNRESFNHKEFGFSGTKYCRRFQGLADTDREDWRIFRHWMREALRTRDVQRWIIERWIAKVWMKSFDKNLAVHGGSVEEAFINARIRNSSPVTANHAIKHARSSSDPITAQLEAYTMKKFGGRSSHKRRFGRMKRAVVLYRHYSTS